MFKKCVECADCPDEVTLTDMRNDVDNIEVCEDDFDSKEEYDQAISVTEALGSVNVNNSSQVVFKKFEIRTHRSNKE